VPSAERQGTPIPCTFQEPTYTDSDSAFIRNLGHHVVETPAAFDMIGPSTLVFGVHLYIGNYADILRNHLPALYIGTRPGHWIELVTWLQTYTDVGGI